MAYTFGNKCAKNCCKWTILVQLVIKDVVICFLRQCMSWCKHQDCNYLSYLER